MLSDDTNEVQIRLLVWLLKRWNVSFSGGETHWSDLILLEQNKGEL